METWTTPALLQDPPCFPEDPQVKCPVYWDASRLEDSLWQLRRSLSPLTCYCYCWLLFTPDWAFLSPLLIPLAYFFRASKNGSSGQLGQLRTDPPHLSSKEGGSLSLCGAFPTHPSQPQQYQSPCTSCGEILERSLVSAVPPVGLIIAFSQY